MSDIFVGYAEEDRKRVGPLVKVLEKAGWSVFWDPQIRTGRRWQKKIEEEIKSCRCVVVVWTSNSIQSDWVYNEAELGKRRDVLFPVMFDSVDPPLGFLHIQTAQLIGWDESPETPPLRALIDDIGHFIGAPASPVLSNSNVGAAGSSSQEPPYSRPPANPVVQNGADNSQVSTSEVPATTTANASEWESGSDGAANLGLMRFFESVGSLWEFLRDIATVLRPCRVSALAIAVGMVLLFSSQGIELTVRLPHQGFARVFWFEASVFLWAFQSWYWAHLLLAMTLRSDRNASLNHPRPRRIYGLTVQIPRFMISFCYLVAVSCSLLAGPAGWGISLALAVQGVLFYGFAVLQRDWVGGEGVANAGTWKHKLFLRRGPDPSMRSLPLFSFAIIVVTLILTAALTVWVFVEPVDFGWFFGSAALPFLVLSVLVPVGSLLVLWSRKGGVRRSVADTQLTAVVAQGYPVIRLLLVLAVAWTFFPAFDNHNVRTIPNANQTAAMRLDPFLEQWRAQAPRQNNRANLIVVATAGGGLRAAFWTATILGAIQDRASTFRHQLFAISGVSGGSLGATVFVTLASGGLSLSDNTGSCGEDVGRYECAGQAVLSQDFLAPAYAALLPDMIQSFVPLGFSDRARAFEQGWEQAWGRAGFSNNVWGDHGFRSLWGRSDFLPALLLNSTHVETGRRVITSNLDIAASPEVFRDTYDFYGLIPPGSEIRPSTAAHNSARIPYGSPLAVLADGTHLAEGGYFENFGAITAREILKAGINRLGRTVRPIVVLISNDPSLGEVELPALSAISPRPARRETWASQVLGPVRALLHTRQARGLLAAYELRALAEETGGKYFQFRLCREPGRFDPALGWVLSPESEDLMRKQLRSDTCGNAAMLRSLLQALEGPES